MQRRVRILSIVLVVVLLATALVWYAAFLEDKRGQLTISFLDVGQGDAVFIDAPSGRQVLIDGGPDASVLRALSEAMPWYDRSIDLMIATHPDLDHIGGLIDVLDRYAVDTIMQSSVLGTTPTWATLERKIENEGGNVAYAERGQVIDIGKGARIEILFPDRDVPHLETNVGCVIARVVYGNTSIMLPCDTTKAIEEYLVALDSKGLQSNILKAAHHGSKTSSSALFVGAVDPQFAIYSRGCGNSYGHPHQEVIDTYARFEIPTLDTCEEGTITFVSDGERIVRK